MGRIAPGFGLVVIEPRHDSDALTAIGVGTRDSSYTQAGATPGQSIPSDGSSTWRPQASRAQSVDLELLSIRGGYAGRAGAEVLYRVAGESLSTDYRGWSDPNLVTGFTAGASYLGGSDAWGSSAAWGTVAACGTPEGYLVIVAVDPVNEVGQAWRYDTRSGEWTEGQTFAANAPGLQGPIGLVYDTDRDRAVLYSGTEANAGVRQAAFYSTDAGLTFAGFSRRTLSGTSAGNQDGAMRIAARPGGFDWLMFTLNAVDGSGDGSQWASSDAGSSWRLVDVVSGTSLGLWPVWTGTHYLVAYIDSSDQLAKVRLLSSAAAKFDDAAAITIDASREGQLVVPVVDSDGIIYAYVSRIDSGVVYEDLAVYRSLDGGATWDRYLTDAITTGGSTVYHTWHAAVAAAGCVYLIGISSGYAETDGTIGVLRLGGWGQVAAGPGVHGTILGHERRTGWGDSVGTTAIEGLVYLPSGRPDQRGWTDHSGSGATGTSLAVVEVDALRLSASSGAAREWRYTCTGAAKASIMFESEVHVRAADTRAAALAAAGGNLHATLRLSDGSTYEYEVIVHFCSDGIALEDANSGATIDSIALTMGSSSPTYPLTWTRVRVHLVAGRVDWWYAQGTGDLAETWTKGTGGTVSNGSAATQSRIVWGMAALISAQAIDWRWLGVAFGGEWQHGLDGVGEWEQTYSDGVRGHVEGRPVPGRSQPYPLPELSPSGVIGGLSATGGPTYLGEIVDLPTAYAYGIGSLHPIRSPSPRDEWRSTDTSEVLLVYDLEAAQWYGDGLALLAVRARPYEWIVETDDGSTGWTTIGTLDLTLGSSLTYTRTGAVVVANGGTAIDRYFSEGELVGGYLVAGGAAASIVASSAGWWGGSGTRQQVRITVGAIGSLPASGSDLRLVAAQGLLVVYPTSVVLRRYVRIRAASGAVVPSSRYTAGVLALGRVLGLGADPAWQWTRDTALVVRRSRSSDGVSVARELGPPVRRISYAWPEYQALAELRDASSYVASSTGLPIGTGEDSASLPALLEVLQSGEVPVVVVPRLPTSSGSTLRGRDELVYGRVISDTLQVAGVLGTEGTDEVVTVGALTVEELR